MALYYGTSTWLYLIDTWKSEKEKFIYKMALNKILNLYTNNEYTSRVDSTIRIYKYIPIYIRVSITVYI